MSQDRVVELHLSALTMTFQLRANGGLRERFLAEECLWRWVQGVCFLKEMSNALCRQGPRVFLAEFWGPDSFSRPHVRQEVLINGLEARESL